MAHPRTITGHCDSGVGCSLIQPGHRLQFYVRRLADADSRNWADAQVVGFIAGWAVLQDWASGHRFSIWQHDGLERYLAVGDLVAINRKYGVLARADERWSVMLTEESVL
jgi:hypothetical protein